MDSIVGTEYLPNAHIEKIKLQILPDSYKAIVTVSLYDYKEGTWSLDEKFTQYLSIRMKTVRNKTEIQDLISGNRSYFEFPSSEYEILPFSAMEETLVSIRGKNYKKFKANITYSFDQEVNANWCVFCASFIDTEQLIQDEGLNLSFAPSKNYLGSLKAEKILEDGEVLIGNHTLFRDSDGTPWSGPIHRHQVSSATIVSEREVIFMGGSQHLPITHPTLTGERIEGQKLETYQSALLEDTLLDGISSDPVIDPFAPNPSFQGGVYEEDAVEDQFRNVSSTTIMDLENILIQESLSSQLMAFYNNSLFKNLVQNMNLGGVLVNRFPITRPNATILNRLGVATNLVNLAEPTLIARSNNNNRKVKEKVLYKISPRKIISVDPRDIEEDRLNEKFDGKRITRSLIKNSKPIGKVEQLNLSLPKNLRAINFTDYDISESKFGKYRYQIKLTMKDEPYLYCKDLLKESFRNVKKLQNLYDVIIMKNVFNGDHFTNEFIQQFYSQYDITVNDEGLVVGEFDSPTLRDSYLIKAFEVLHQIETLVGIKRPMAKTLRTSVNMFATNPDRILSTIDYYSKTINKFKDMYKLSDGQGFEKVSPKKRKDRGVIDVTFNLKKTYERKKLMPIGMNFIDMNKISGLSRINMQKFMQRSEKEKKKFFPGLINKDSKEVKGLPTEFRDMFADLETNRYKDFTPAKIFFGDKELDTTEINTESFDADFFNTLRVTTAAIQSNESIDEQDQIGDTPEELDSYIDSREFLGDTSKFNNTLLTVLGKRPLKAQKVRKKFKLLDNKILKAQKKNISLKTFDISQPNNSISALVKTQAKSIPMQLKALSLLKTNMTNFDLDTIEFDPISNPQTQEVFSQNYLNIGKVMALEGFETVNGRLAMNKPIYKEIEPKMLDNLKERNVLCKIVPQAFEGLTIDSSPYNIHDKVFVLESTSRDQMNVQQLSSTGGEQDLTMPEEEEELVPLEQLVLIPSPDVSPAEYSNTTPIQNLENSAVISIFPLEGSPQAVTVVDSPAPPTTTAPTSPPGVNY